MKKQFLILGPCAVESEDMYWQIGTYLYQLSKKLNFDLIYKASFSKENRTSLEGESGLGLERCIEIFKEMKRRIPDIKLITDVHETYQIKYLQDCIDVIQIPAFLSRQTPLIVECAKAFDTVFVKKMQHLGPNNLIKSVDKIKNTNPDCQAWIGERGVSHGYDKLLIDVTIVDELKKYYDKVILDATHSIQHSRAIYGHQGERKYAERYFLSSPVFHYDGTFAEVHPEPHKAISDADCQIELNKIEELIEKQKNIMGLIEDET